eukprot:GEMP01053140.1.p1 GENE.GEMP01053140.1~~GEMP01053140.1.p1  ORF type:complete len:353 (-),score=17.57 GEMP01053140.1:492-1550(-)
MMPSFACPAPAFRWWTTTHRLFSSVSICAPTLQLPQRARQLSTLRSWSDIGILNLQAFRQEFATSTEDLFSNSVFNVDMAINKRAEFARNEIGLRAFKQHSKHPVEDAEIHVRSSQLYYGRFHHRYSFHWHNVLCVDKKALVLVGFLPDEVKVWLWDADVVGACACGVVIIVGGMGATCEEFDRSPGELIANIQYDDDEAWNRFGFESNFRVTLAQYKTKGERVYAKTLFKGLALGTQHKLFAEISHRILDSFPGTKKLSHRVLPRCSRVYFPKTKNIFELHFKNILRDQADYALLLPFYPDRIEAYLCKNQAIIHNLTECNHLLFNGSLDEQGQPPKHIKLPGRFLASLPF